MNLTEIRTDDWTFLPRSVRSPGIHVSEIIRDIENNVTKRGKRKKFDDLNSEEKRRMGTYVTGGFAWEEIVRSAVVAMYGVNSDRFTNPGELERDNIFGTPDGFDIEDWVVEEFKCTWRSSRRALDLESEFWSWFVQIKAYCKMLDSRIARLRVFFVNGNYRDSGPQIKCWQIEFTQEEIDMNWAMLLQHAKTLRRKHKK